MIGFFSDHLLFLVCLFFVVETNQRELAIEVVFLLQQSIELSQEEFFPKSFANGLELSNLVQLIAELRLYRDYLGIFFSILLEDIADSFLYFSKLDVGKIAVGVEN